MTTNPNTAPLDPHALTPAELAYAQSGDTDALVKEGLIQPEPVPQPQPAPQAVQPEPQQQTAEPDDEDQPELDTRGRPKQRGQWVNKKALDAERAERQRLSQQLAERTEAWTRLEERFKVFQEALNAPEPREEEEAEEPLPDPEQDIIGFNRALAERMDRRFAQISEALNGVNQQVGQVNEQSAAERQQNAMLTTYRQDAAAFAQQQPDFADAYRFLISSRNAELEAGGYSDPVERQRLIVADEQALVARSLQTKASPAERIYALAKARGYQVKVPANGANGATANGANGNGAAPQPQPQPQQAPQPSVTEEIARLQKGQEAALSLSNVGGQRPQALTIEQIADMPQDQFNALMRKNPGMVEALLGKGQ